MLAPSRVFVPGPDLVNPPLSLMALLTMVLKPLSVMVQKDAAVVNGLAEKRGGLPPR